MPFPFIAAAGLASSALGGYFASRGQKQANIATRDMVREQMAFQERMSGTSYQRAVKDMRLAGINPMLAIQQGGASTPGGASAEMKSTLGPAVSSAIAVRRMTAEIEAIGAGIQKTRAETDAIRGRPGRILEPAVDVGVDVSRNLISGIRDMEIPSRVRKNARILNFEGGSSARAVLRSMNSLRERLKRAGMLGSAVVREFIERLRR